MNEDLASTMINKFWSEHEDFHAKKGKYGNREHIFKNHVDIIGGRSHVWHKKESVRYTDLFGNFATRVCSKTLGIGSAERAWGDVKHLKTNKRSHLSGDRIKKQATIYGASCMFEAATKRDLPTKYEYDSSWKPNRYWTEDDGNLIYTLGNEGDQSGTILSAPKRTFNAWFEDWELDAVRKNDPVAEHKLLKKYGGLMWKDADCTTHTKYFISDSNSMKWFRLTKKGGGWAVIAYDQFYDANSSPEEKEKHSEPWEITDDLIDSIEEYYTIINPTSDILLVKNDKA